MDEPKTEEQINNKVDESEESKLVNASSETPFSDEYEKINLARALGIENLNDIKKYDTQLNRLAEWARMKGAKDNIDVVWQVKQLASRVGNPPLGENLTRHLATYAYLEIERMRIEANMKKMENP